MKYTRLLVLVVAKALWMLPTFLKPALARGELKAIGATTLNEYQKYFEKDKALRTSFPKVMIDEPSHAEDAISILRGLKEKYETHHQSTN
jgi:ATP-dependent Clp protease ATP-binding subunit ClpB